MPRIETYDAPLQRLSAEERGADAATRAGRYVGQYRRQEAEDLKAGGILQAQGIRERGWPFDILALEQQGEGSGSGGGRGGGGGGGFKTAGGGSTDPFAEHGQASRGARALGNIAQRFNGGGSAIHGGYRNSIIDTATGRDLLGPQPRGGSRQQHQPVPYTLEGGRFVPAGKDPMLGYNDAAAKDAEAWYLKGPYGNDPATGAPYNSVGTGAPTGDPLYDNNLGSRGAQEFGNLTGDAYRNFTSGVSGAFNDDVNAVDSAVRGLSDWVSPPARTGDLTNPDNE